MTVPRVNIPLINTRKKMYADLSTTLSMSLKWTKGYSKAGTAAAHWNHVVDKLAAEGASPPSLPFLLDAEPAPPGSSSR